MLFLILNIEFLIVEEQSVILQFFQNYFLILLPVVTIILGIIVIRWITFTGEEIFRTMFWKKNYEITKTFTVDSTFKSYFGKTIVSFQEDEIGFRLMRLDLQAFFGSVVVEVPENIAVRGEARGLLCRVDSFGKRRFT